MKPAFISQRVVAYHGSALEVFRALPDGIARTSVNSPPYYGLRSYGTNPQVWGGDPEHAHQFSQETRPGQSGGPSEKQLSNQGSWFASHEHGFCECGAWRGELGLEPTPELYIEHLVSIYRELRRCLTPDGTLWVNIADSYANTGGHTSHGASSAMSGRTAIVDGHLNAVKSRIPPGLKPKDLIGIPWMLAFALRADGWYLRADCIWHKPNGMCESSKDRPTVKDKEYVFLFSRSQDYYFDMEAVREPYSAATLAQLGQNYQGQGQKLYEEEGVQNPSDAKRSMIRSIEANPAGRHLRSVWSIHTRGTTEAHFASMPLRIAERCILATSSERGRCPTCRKPWVRVIEETRTNYQSRPDRQVATGGALSGGTGKNFPDTRVRTLGWEPSCTCGLPNPEPDVVLEPFLGTGTTALAARRLGRACVASELQEKYLQIAERRLAHGSLEFEEEEDYEVEE